MRRVLPLLALAACIESRIPDLPQWADVPASRPIADETQVDRIVQLTAPRVDVLWTIDNSGSMAPYQEALVENFPAFIDFFVGSGLDWHVGVTSTDVEGTYLGARGTLVAVAGEPFLDADSPSPLSMFEAMATLGTSGSSVECGLGATYLALEVERDGANAGFWRDDAAIHTIVISDEPDQTPPSLLSREEFTAWYAGLKPTVDLRTFSSIVDRRAGAAYLAVTAAIGGVEAGIHDDDWSGVLEALGMQAAGLRQEYFLSRLPAPETLSVVVEEAEGVRLVFDPADWRYDEGRNSVTFLEYVPGSLATVELTYTVRASQQQAR